MIPKRVQLAAKAEATEGTEIALAPADALLVANYKFKPDVDISKRNLASASMSPFAAIPGKRWCGIEFDVELKGSGAAGTPPAFGKLLKACGFAETIAAGVSVTYDPASSGFDSLTQAGYIDGMIQTIWGSRGNAKLALKNGEPGWLHFDFIGCDFSEADGDMLTGVSYEATKPPAFLSAQLSIDSYAAIIESLEIDMNTVMGLRGSANEASGYLAARIAGREPTMSFDPEKTKVATYDWYTKLKAGNEGAFTTQIGATAGNICTITAPKAQYIKIDEAEREVVRSLGVDLQLNRDTGDDEISLVFT